MEPIGPQVFARIQQRVVCVAFNAGTGASEDFRLDEGASWEVPDIVLRMEAGEIGGTAFYPDGTPAKDLGIVAVDANEFHHARAEIMRLDQLLPRHLSPSSECVDGKSRTDPNGRFHLQV